MRTTMVFCVLLLMTCGAAVACVLYAARGNFKPQRNRIFLLINAAVVVWAFGLAMTAAASTGWISAVGRRIAPLGWGPLTALALHFLLLLTGEEAVLRRRWAYPALYLPAAVTVVAYSVLPLFGLNADVLVDTRYGWVNVSAPDFWDVLYYAYAGVYASLGVLLLWRWEKRSASDSVIKQARILRYAMFATALLSTVSDILPPFIGVRIPQFAALFMLILIFAVGYCINRYSFLQVEEESPDETILSRAARTHVYRYLGVVLALQAVAAFLGRDLLYRDPGSEPVALVPAILLADAAFLFAINRMRIQEHTKEMLVALSAALLIPFVTLWFANYEAMTVWPVSFVIMLMCLLFNRQIMLISMIVITLLTQLFQWAYLPEAVFGVSADAYVVRLVIIFLATMVAVYVNRVYTARLRENANNAKMQFMVGEISHDFVGSGMDFDQKLHAMLKRVGLFLECDHAYLVLLDDEREKPRYHCQWLAEGGQSPMEDFQGFAKTMSTVMIRKIRAEKVMVLKDARFMAPGASAFRKHLLAQGIRGLITVPIENAAGAVTGFLGFSSGQPLRKWRYVPPAFLEIVSGIVSDAVSIAESEQELNQMAYYDQLTGLPNRILFRERLSQAIRAAEENGGMLGIAFLDLDSFKAVNDTMGHDQGDRFLAEAAHILARAVRGSDMLARFGGDEFILLLSHVPNQDELRRIMDRIMEAVQKPIVIDGQEFFVSVSAGLALYPEDGLEPETLIKHADTAMYSAKGTGKGQYALCSQEMKDEVLSRTRLTNLLYRALENDQFELYYQPQIDLASQRVVGMEALIRWRLPGEELIEPAAFVPLAEQTGLISPIGEWMLMKACAQNAAWQAQGHAGLRVAVNISAHQLTNPGFVRQVQDTLKKAGLKPCFLELEITENTASVNTDEIAEILGRLKAVGVTIAIDNFGTEYSSLSRLKLLPIDRIKMDMQFVQGIETSEKDRAISRVIINLAQSLNIKVIAEGVETAAQRDFLRARQCDEAQGFLYFRPMPACEAEAALDRA